MGNLLTNGLRKLVNSDKEYPEGDREATVIAVSTVKGGVGKTTTAVNLAVGLADQIEEDSRALLIDLDAQGHCQASLAELVPSISGVDTVSEILLSEKNLDLLDAIVSTQIDNLDLTVADEGLSEAEGQISQKIGKERLLSEALQFTRTHYDYIIVDCPPNKGNLTINALFAADGVVVPTELSPLSVQGADELLGTVMKVNRRLDHETDILGIVLTMVDKRTGAINDDVLEQIESAWSELVFDAQIGINTAIKKAQLAGEPIYDFAPRSRGANHYRELTRELAERIE